MFPGTRPRLIKTTAAILAFVPGVLLVLNLLRVIPYSSMVGAAGVLDYPALGLTKLWVEFNPNRVIAIIVLLVTMLLWSALVAVVFWKLAAFFLGEDEVGGQKFDWIGFQVRFFCGFVIGFLIGWRIVRYSDGKTILLWMIGSGVFLGLVFGASKPDFWARSL